MAEILWYSIMKSLRGTLWLKVSNLIYNSFFLVVSQIWHWSKVIESLNPIPRAFLHLYNIWGQLDIPTEFQEYSAKLPPILVKKTLNQILARIDQVFSDGKSNLQKCPGFFPTCEQLGRTFTLFTCYVWKVTKLGRYDASMYNFFTNTARLKWHCTL